MKNNFGYIYFTGGHSCSLFLTNEQDNDTSPWTRRVSEQRYILEGNRDIYQNNTGYCECLNECNIYYSNIKSASQIFRATDSSPNELISQNISNSRDCI